MNSNIIGSFLFLLNLFDGYGTYIQAKSSGINIELNPIMRSLMIATSLEWWLLIKILAGLVLWIIIYLRWEKYLIDRKFVIYFLITAYFCVSMIHIFNILL